MNRDQLFDAMVNRKPIYINGVRYMLNSMEMEDGTGFAFNLTLSRNIGADFKVFYRCEKQKNHKILRETAYYIEIG